MKRISAIAGSTFGVLILLSSFATSVRADPTLLISTGTPDGSLTRPVPDLNTFKLCGGELGPCDLLHLKNTSTFVFTDFHIVISPPLSTPIDARGFGDFELAGATGSTVDFNISGGLRPGETFTISFLGFSSDTMAFANATSTPEPTTMVLLGTGLAGVAIKLRKRHKTRRQ